jgi:hypothetical protein
MRPTREIRPTACSVTGKVSSQKANRFIEFESHLEKRFLLQVEVDPCVASFCEQPVSIPYKDEDGKDRVYTPDFRVTYNQALLQAPSDLVEIKYSMDLVKHREELAPKLAAGAEFAATHGMRFRIVTEKDLPMEAHHTVMTLRTFVRMAPEPFHEDAVIHALRFPGISTPAGLLKAIGATKEDAPVFLRALWSLVIHGRIYADLKSTPGLETRVWLPNTRGVSHEQE